MQAFRLNQVKLLPSPFLAAEQTDLQYMLKLDPDRLLVPFLREAGLKTRALSYGNWENTGLDGHTAGHYLTALAQMYASAGSMVCKKRLDYMVSELARCQQKNGNGYVGGVPGGDSMWALLKNGNLSEYNKKWVPWYNMHKLFAGLRDACQIGKNQQAKTVLIKLTDWAYDELNGLTDEQLQRMLNMEYGGMNEVCADVYAITGNKKYLTLAQKFSHRAILAPLEQKRDVLNGLHANTQIPKVIGFERIGELANDTAYFSAARYFWQTVVQNRTISIGGNSVREHFNPSDNFLPMVESEQGPETCNSNNMLKLSKMLFLDDQRAAYINFYERLLYNHILSSQHPVTGGFVYFTPIHPQHYRVYSTADESFWCCVGTGMENHGKYAEMVYTHANGSLYVNLFIPSVLKWQEKGLELEQQTAFPESERTELKLKLRAPGRFALMIRKPDWIKENGFTIKINNAAYTPKVAKGGYVAIERVWKTGDRISIALPMKNYIEYLPDHSAWVSFLHGPIVLAAPTDTTNMPGLIANDSRWGHIAGGPMYALNTSPLLTGDSAAIVNAVKPLNTAALNFRIDDAIYQQKFKNLTLMPFYKVHDTRYMLYWPVSAKDSVQQKEAELQLADDAYIKFAANTIDWIAPGEQQPESDHAVKFEDSETGIFRNQHWRNAEGYFSYNLRNAPTVKTINITYYGKEKDREFDIYLNDVKLAHEIADGTGPDNFVNKEYAIPAGLKAGRNLTVKFVASPGHKTAAVYGIRLLK